MNYTYYRRYQPSKRRSGSFRPFFYLVLFLVALTLIFYFIAGAIRAAKEEQEDEAVLTVNRGSAEVLEWGETEAKAAADTQIVLLGDTVESGDSSSVTLSFANGYRVTLNENTRLQLLQFTESENEQIYSLDLLEGVLRVSHEEVENESFHLEVHTDVMNVLSIGSVYYVANQANAEYVSVVAGQVSVEYVDRSNDQVIETKTVLTSQKSFLDAEKEQALLNRENVILVEAGEVEMEFVEGVASEGETEEEVPQEKPVEAQAVEDEPEEEEVPSEEPKRPASPLQIQISSPVSGSTITETAIAIEGRIVQGSAARVTVTWSGNGVPYELSFFEVGSGSFRYVADTAYANFASGQNTYTITAYDTDGNSSNSVTVVINGEF